MSHFHMLKPMVVGVCLAFTEVGTGESSKGTSGHGEGPSQLQEIFKKAKRIQHSTSLLDEWTGDPPPDVTITPISMLSRCSVLQYQLSLFTTSISTSSVSKASVMFQNTILRSSISCL